MWTVIGTLNNDEQIRPEAEGSHAFLILSQEDSTMVLYFLCSHNFEFLNIVIYCLRLKYLIFRYCKLAKKLMK